MIKGEGKVNPLKSVLVLFTFLGLLLTNGVLAQDKKGGDESKPEPANAGFDHNHQAWTGILKKYLVVNGPVSQFKYSDIRSDLQPLNDYLKSLSSVTKSEFNKWSREQQMSFYINAYNAFTIKLIADKKPKKSIKDIREGLFTGPWKIKFFTLLGEKMHLDHIEHKILRPQYKEPRIHFAVNCASIGCPMLRGEAFVADRLEKQLEEQAFLFLRDKNRNRIDTKEKKVYLSRIFDWFEKDFLKGSKSVQQYAAKYMTDDKELQKQIAEYDDKYLDYDWNLNKVK